MSTHKPLLASIIKIKCPKCREGRMFPEGTLYSSKFATMNKNCPSCGQNLEPEPGYYFGAMYISFAFNVGIFLVSFFILNQLVENLSVGLFLGVLICIVVGLLPIIYRLSRVLWISIFIDYVPRESQMQRNKDI